MRRAFTLIELLVVIAIIALLISILVPSLSRAKDMAKCVECSLRLKGMGVAFGKYAQDHMGIWPAPEQTDWYGQWPYVMSYYAAMEYPPVGQPLYGSYIYDYGHGTMPMSGWYQDDGKLGGEPGWTGHPHYGPRDVPNMFCPILLKQDVYWWYDGEEDDVKYTTWDYVPMGRNSSGNYSIWVYPRLKNFTHPETSLVLLDMKGRDNQPWAWYYDERINPHLGGSNCLLADYSVRRYDEESLTEYMFQADSDD